MNRIPLLSPVLHHTRLEQERSPARTGYRTPQHRTSGKGNGCCRKHSQGFMFVAFLFRIRQSPYFSNSQRHILKGQTQPKRSAQLSIFTWCRRYRTTASLASIRSDLVLLLEEWVTQPQSGAGQGRAARYCFHVFPWCRCLRRSYQQRRLTAHGAGVQPCRAGPGARRM